MIFIVLFISCTILYLFGWKILNIFFSVTNIYRSHVTYICLYISYVNIWVKKRIKCWLAWVSRISLLKNTSVISQKNTQGLTALWERFHLSIFWLLWWPEINILVTMATRSKFSGYFDNQNHPVVDLHDFICAPSQSPSLNFFFIYDFFIYESINDYLYTFFLSTIFIFFFYLWFFLLPLGGEVSNQFGGIEFLSREITPRYHISR